MQQRSAPRWHSRRQRLRVARRSAAGFRDAVAGCEPCALCDIAALLVQRSISRICPGLSSAPHTLRAVCATGSPRASRRPGDARVASTARRFRILPEASEPPGGYGREPARRILPEVSEPPGGYGRELARRILPEASEPPGGYEEELARRILPEVWGPPGGSWGVSPCPDLSKRRTSRPRCRTLIWRSSSLGRRATRLVPR